jgi:hypothetical protein
MREVDHSPAIGAELQEMWIYATTPTYAFLGQRLNRL